jgi:hypothetical protein
MQTYNYALSCEWASTSPSLNTDEPDVRIKILRKLMRPDVTLTHQQTLPPQPLFGVVKTHISFASIRPDRTFN